MKMETKKRDKEGSFVCFFFNIELKTAMSKNVPAQYIYKLMKKINQQVGNNLSRAKKKENITLRKGQSSH